MYGNFAKVYDELMQEVNYKDWADYLFRITLNSIKPVKKILEFGCGTGNITIPLAKYGFDVTAVDLSDDMLTVADEKLAKQHIDNVRLFKGDMSNFVIHETFDAVICCCDSFNYLKNMTEVENFIMCAIDALNPGGLLLFDMNTPDKYKNIIGNNTFVYNLDNVFCVWENTYHGDEKCVDFDLSFFAKRDDGLYERYEEEQRQYFYPVVDIFKCLKIPALKNAKIYDFGQFIAGGPGSERVQYVAEKR